MSSSNEKSFPKTCPKCASDWGTGDTTFCGVCGFSERLGREGSFEELTSPTSPSQAGMVLFVVGIIVIPMAIAVARCCTWEADNHYTWLIWLAGIGGGMALIGHVLAWCVCVGQSGMELTDIVFSPLRIWGMIIRSLPKGVTAMCLFGFGVMTAASAGIFFGPDYETLVRQRPYETREQLLGIIDTVQNIVPNLGIFTAGSDAAELAMDTESANGTLDMNGTTPVSISSDEVAASAVTDCLVIGYVENADGELNSLVLAVPQKNNLRYAGTVAIGSVDPDAYADLIKHSLSLEVRKPLVDSPITATWLKPDAVCRVEHHGWSPTGELRSARILEVTRHLASE